MSAVAYTEQILSTANTKFAAVLQMFGGKLRSHLPLEWVNEFQSKADYLAWRRNPSGPIQPKIQVYFNFNPAGLDGPGIFAAFQNTNAEDEFARALEETVPDLERRKELMASHSGAVANACSQTLNAREFLMKLMARVGDESKWILVRGQGVASVRFGKNASKETIAEYLAKL